MIFAETKCWVMMGETEKEREIFGKQSNEGRKITLENLEVALKQLCDNRINPQVVLQYRMLMARFKYAGNKKIVSKANFNRVSRK